MASSSAVTTSALLPKTLFSFLLLLLLAPSTSPKPGTAADSSCYTSIFSFGDSLTDTGNLLHIDKDIYPPIHLAFPPYGETFFGAPTGRNCDGRLIIDFIAEYLGLGLLPPYIGGDGRSINGINSRGGVNFAVAGATALNSQFFEARGIYDDFTKYSLAVQMEWFKNMLPSLCQSSLECHKYFQSSILIMGEIGGNDYNHALLNFARSPIEILSFFRPVINAIASAMHDLIHLGAQTVIVPGILPIGCLSAYLTQYASSDRRDYDPETGCLTWINKIAEHHNELLQIELNLLRELHPHATIIYADYYNAAMPLYSSPEEFGFTMGARRSCCGAGGPYNYNQDVICGDAGATVCDNPSQYVNWDGLHLTEAANRFVAKGLFEGPYTHPHIRTLCNINPLAGTNGTNKYSS